MDQIGPDEGVFGEQHFSLEPNGGIQFFREFSVDQIQKGCFPLQDPRPSSSNEARIFL